MKSKGYKLEKIYTVGGDLVSYNNIDKYFSIEFVKTMVERKLSMIEGLLILNFSLINIPTT